MSLRVKKATNLRHPRSIMPGSSTRMIIIFMNARPLPGRSKASSRRCCEARSRRTGFGAYLNLGLIEKILGHDRLIPCSAGKDFAFIDPWSDVWACNVRSDLPMGNLARQSWDEILNGEVAQGDAQESSEGCGQNCWMVTTARHARMRSNIVPQMPKAEPMMWVLKNKMKGLHRQERSASTATSTIQMSGHLRSSSAKRYLNRTVKAKLVKGRVTPD